MFFSSLFGKIIITGNIIMNIFVEYKKVGVLHGNKDREISKGNES